MGGGKTTSTTTTTIPKEIRQRGTRITNAAMSHYFNPADKYQSYDPSQYRAIGEATTAPLSQRYGQAGQNFNDAGRYTQGFDQARQTASNMANYNAGNVNAPQYNTATIQNYQNPYNDLVMGQGLRTIMDQMNQGRLQNQGRAAAAGAFGGARHGVLDSLNQQNAMQSLNDFVGTQLYQGFNDARGAMDSDFNRQYQSQEQANRAAQQNANRDLSLSQVYSNLAQQDYANQIGLGQANMNLGEMETRQEQAVRDNAYQLGYMDQREYPIQMYERLAAMNAMQPHNRTSTSTQSQSGGWLGPAVGAAGQIGAAYFSDERAKENIKERDPEEVLSALASVKPYTYTYTDDAISKGAEKGERRGFMAQDLERAMGRKSGPERDGYKTVDVPNIIGDLMASVHALEKRTRNLKPRKKV